MATTPTPRTVIPLRRTSRPRRQPLWREAVGGVLRAERQRQGRTLGDVATSARMSVPYLSEVERGRKEASSEILAAAAAALHLQLADLLDLVHRELMAERRSVLDLTTSTTGGRTAYPRVPTRSGPSALAA